MFQENIYSLGRYRPHYGDAHGRFDIIQPAEIYDPTKGQRATGRPNAFYVHPMNLGEEPEVKKKKRRKSKYGGFVSPHSTGVHFGKKQRKRRRQRRGRGRNKLLLAASILAIPVSLFVGWKVGKG
jgi:hypothetical protein